jgi:hypothetical protein
MILSEQTDIWLWWKQALAGNMGPIHSEPQQGFYRTRDKAGNWVPVALWIDSRSGEPQWMALLAAVETDALKIWPRCCRYPITHAAYQAAIEGKGFSDEPPAWVEPNVMPDDPAELLKMELSDKADLARAALKAPISSQDAADRAAILSKQLAGIASKAKAFHETEKRPHLDASRAVDDKWRALKDEPDSLSKELKRHQDKWLIERDRLEKERQRVAKAEADRLAREDVELAAKVQQSDQQTAAQRAEAEAAAQKLQDASDAAQREAQARSVASGRTGAKVSLRTFRIAVITDYDKLLVTLKDREEIKELVTSLANRAAKSGFKLDGMEIREEKRAV